MPQKIKKLLFSCRWIGKHMFHAHIHLQQHLGEIRCEVSPSVFMWCTKSATHIYTWSHLQRHTHTVHPNCITLLWSSQWKYSFLMNNPISTWKVTSGLFQKQSFFYRRVICFLDEWVPLPVSGVMGGECTLHHSFGNACTFCRPPLMFFVLCFSPPLPCHFSLSVCTRKSFNFVPALNLQEPLCICTDRT